VAVHELTFDHLIMGLSRKKNQDSVIDRLVVEHSDKAKQLVDAIVNADKTKAAGLREIFRRIPKKTIPLLRDMIVSHDVSRSNSAINILSMMNDIGAEVGLETIQNADPIIADRGAKILRNIGFAAVPFLREKLKDENPSKRGLAILMELDPDAMNFFENALEDMLGTQDQILSRYAIDAAASIGDFALPILIDLIGSVDPYEQQNATNALIKIGEPIVIELIEELDNPNSITQQNAIRALKEIGLPAVPALKDALNSESQLIKQNATAVLNSPAFKNKRKIFSRFKKN